MIVTMHQRLPGSAVMAPGALESIPGERMKVRVEPDTSVDALVASASIDDDGRGYTLALEIDDGLVPILEEVPGVDWSVT